MSNATSKDFVLTEYAKNLIEFKARQLSQRWGFGQSDREELQQELWLAVVSQADRFDPDRASLDTYIDRVVNSAVAMILRSRDRKKRAGGIDAVSLDAAISDDGKQPMASMISEDSHYRRLGTQRRDDIVDKELAEAISDARAKMPPEADDVCHRVMNGSVSSAASDLKTSRRQVRNSLATARQFFEESGLGPN